jgi:hypothetical protein
VREPHNDARRADAAAASPARTEHVASITELLTTRDAGKIEQLADELSAGGADNWTGSAREQLIEALVLCLAGDSVRQDADAEDAICSALEEIGVMTHIDNLVFEFVPDDKLDANDLAALRRFRGWLPIKYTKSEPARDLRRGLPGPPASAKSR